jgi:hypothetical protein
MNPNKIISLGIAALVLLLLVVPTITTTEKEEKEAYASNLQYSPAAQNILDLVQSDCERVIDSAGLGETLPADCVAIKHESQPWSF